MQFSFSQEELFTSLAPFKGHMRRSLIGMYKKCTSIEQMTSIGNFLAYNNLGGWYYRLDKNHKLICYCYLNETNKRAVKLIKELVAV